jgi:3-oxoacyl-[acyl-carrier protein] reductase
MGKNVPMGRVGEASEVGNVICFLSSEKASYVTGTAINVDGGSSPVV